MVQEFDQESNDRHVHSPMTFPDDFRTDDPVKMSSKEKTEMLANAPMVVRGYYAVPKVKERGNEVM